jgi:hypothetical protein
MPAAVAYLAPAGSLRAVPFEQRDDAGDDRADGSAADVEEVSEDVAGQETAQAGDPLRRSDVCDTPILDTLHVLITHRLQDVAAGGPCGPAVVR